MIGLVRLLGSLAVASALALFVGCRPAPSDAQPLVVLVSIDGFRWDYLDTFAPPTLRALAAEGVRSEGLIPQFPSKTFPNHYTVVTGLRPANHGILFNNMVAPDLPGRFSMSNREILADPRWWGGEPIWNTAERQGLLTSPMFWPGSEAPIGGRRPAYPTTYDAGMADDARVAKILEWLALPDGKRPSFLTLYFSDVDSAGHSRGPASHEVRDAVARVDTALARLVRGVRESAIADRVQFVIVSDHGMAQVPADHMIVLDTLIDTTTVDVIEWSPVVTMIPKDGDTDALYANLKGRHRALTVYRGSELPEAYGLAAHPRLPPIVGIADEGWHITSSHDIRRWSAGDGHAPGGNHGYDPRHRSMHGLFIAAGSRLQRGMTVPPFENIHLYELMCALLGIEPAKNDGDFAVTRPMLR